MPFPASPYHDTGLLAGLLDQFRILDGVTWFLLIGGWFIFHVLASKRAANERLCSQIDDAIALVEQLEPRAIEFWYSPGSEEEDQAVQRQQMITKIDQLERRLEALKVRKRRFVFDSEINVFSRSILDGDGESLTRSRLRSDDPRMVRIGDAARTLVEKLDQAR